MSLYACILFCRNQLDMEPQAFTTHTLGENVLIHARTCVRSRWCTLFTFDVFRTLFSWQSFLLLIFANLLFVAIAATLLTVQRSVKEKKSLFISKIYSHSFRRTYRTGKYSKYVPVAWNFNRTLFTHSPTFSYGINLSYLFIILLGISIRSSFILERLLIINPSTTITTKIWKINFDFGRKV